MWGKDEANFSITLWEKTKPMPGLDAGPGDGGVRHVETREKTKPNRSSGWVVVRSTRRPSDTFLILEVRNPPFLQEVEGLERFSFDRIAGIKPEKRDRHRSSLARASPHFPRPLHPKENRSSRTSRGCPHIGACLARKAFDSTWVLDLNRLTGVGKGPRIETEANWPARPGRWVEPGSGLGIGFAYLLSPVIVR